MSQRRKLLSIGLAALCVAGLGLGCRGESEAAVAAPLIPDFRLPGLDGHEVGPSDFEGKVLLLEFWATWCGPCRAQATILERLYADVASEDLEFLAISVGEPAEVVERFVEQRPFSYPVLVDSDDELSGELMVYVLPTVAIVDRQGRVVFFEMGISSEGTLRKVLEEALRTESQDVA
jgi:peroxiredoxin